MSFVVGLFGFLAVGWGGALKSLKGNLGLFESLYYRAVRLLQ